MNEIYPAICILNKAIELNDKYWKVYFNKGIVLLKL
jgi:hypothetical protein